MLTEKLNPETYFLRCAFPCAIIRWKVRKKITEEDYKKLEHAVKHNIGLDRDYLEKAFSDAISAMKKRHSDYWRIEAMREFFWHEHEEALKEGFFPEHLMKFCLFKKGRLTENLEKGFKADLGGGDMRNVEALYRDAKVGDAVMVHYNYAVEKI